MPGSVVAWDLSCFSGPGCTILAAQSWGQWFMVHFVTDIRQQLKNFFPFLHKEGWNFGFVLALSWRKTCEAELMPLPSKRRSLWGQSSVLQTQAAGQPCHNFFCIFKCMRKFSLSMSVDSSVQIWALGLLLYIQCRSWGQQQWLFCCITQAQSGISGVSSWVRKQNSSVSKNVLIAAVLQSRGFVVLLVITSFLLEVS